MQSDTPRGAILRRQRWQLLARLMRYSEVPLFILSGFWLLLLVVEVTHGLSPFLWAVSYVIWGLFVLQFCTELLLAPNRALYLRRQWLTILALVLPAFRLFRIARVVRLLRGVRAARSVRLLRVLATANRSAGALASTMRRRGVGYMISITLAVLFAGAAGMLAFERDAPSSPLQSYGSALWWTAMLLTTMGTDYWPTTAEGRVLCLGLSVYAFAAFGYLTAALASFFVGRDQGIARASGGKPSQPPV